MPTYVRRREQGATYFFTVVTYRRQRILTGELSRRILRRAFASVRRRLPFDLLAFVLLPDHLHCMRQIKSLFTREYLALGGRDWDVTEQQSRGQGRRGVWQPRYWEHRIRDEEDYFRHRDYIHLNPVRHGYVEHPEEWAWSSFHRHVRMGWLDAKWPGSSPVELPAIEE